MQNIEDAVKELEGPWLNAKEAALYVRRMSPTSHRTMNHLAKMGEIEGTGWNGDEWRFSKAGLDAWMHRQARIRKKQKQKKKKA